MRAVQYQLASSIRCARPKTPHHLGVRGTVVFVPARYYNSRNQDSQEDAFSRVLHSNKRWAEAVKSKSPSLLPDLSKGQAPKILWLGCSDSRVPETTICDLSPGDIFVHRNIANIINPTDLSALSAIEYAVANIKVEHIVLCGHTSCGGVAGALGNKKIGKIDTWLTPLRRLRMQHAKELDALQSPAEQNRFLVELNVKEGIEVLRENPDVREAMKERGLKVHGVVFDIENGELKELHIDDELEGSRKKAFEVS